MVTQVSGLQDLWVCLATQQEQLEQLMGEMDKFYLKMSSLKTVSEWVVGKSPRCQPSQIFPASYIKKGFHRVLVRNLVEGDKAKIFYLDFGTCQVVRRSQLRFLHTDFVRLPAQAMEARLWGVESLQILLVSSSGPYNRSRLKNSGEKK